MTPDEIKALKVGQTITIRATFEHYDGLAIFADVHGAKFWLPCEGIISAEPLPIEVGDTVDWRSHSGCRVMAVAEGRAMIETGNGLFGAPPLSELTLIKKASDQ